MIARAVAIKVRYIVWDSKIGGEIFGDFVTERDEICVDVMPLLTVQFVLSDSLNFCSASSEKIFFRIASKISTIV